MVNQNHMLQAALEYASKGFAVFPLTIGGKRPAGDLAPNGCKDATTNEDQICEWWTAKPDANIGIATDGLCIVDIDGGDHPWLSDNGRLEALAGSPVSQTPRGGRHYVFRQNGEPLRNTAGRLADHVDTRADGGYIVAAPSVVDGKPYQWIPGCELDSRDDLPTVPEWIVELLATPASRESQVYSESAPIPSGQRNSSLASRGGILRKLGFSCEAINASLQETNRERCEPPLPEDEVYRIAQSVSRYAPDVTASAEADGVLWSDPDEIGPSDSPDDPGPFPQSLLEVPGLMSAVMGFNLATAHKPQPELALAAAIALMSVLTGQTISDRYGTRTNLYILGVCKSGGGKENARKVNKDILTEAGAEDMVGPEGLASHAGLFTAVNLYPRLLLQLDEIGRMLRVLSNPSAAPHLSGIITVLMKMFTASNTTYIGDAYADKDRNRTIDQPHVCMYATTVPNSLYEGFSAESITDGFLGRILIFEATDHAPQRQKPAFMPIPQELIEQVRYWHQFNPCGMAEHVRPRPQIIEYDDRAEEVFEALETEAYQHQIGDNEMIASLWTRTNEKARKLALIYACSESTQSPRVGVEAAQWACDLSRYLTRKLIHTASDWIAENPFDESRKKVLRIIKGAGTKGMTASQLCRKTQAIRKRDRDEILHNLLSSGIVKQETIQRKTKPLTVYIAQ